MLMNCDPKILRESFALFEDQAQFAREIKHIENEIVSSRYATDHMIDVLHPYANKLYGGPPPKWRKLDAKKEPYDQKHDFDSEGKIRRISNRDFQWIVRHNSNYVEKIGVATERFVLDSDSKLLEYHRLSAEGGACTIFHWVDNILESKLHTQWDHEPRKMAGESWGDVQVNAIIRETYRHDSEGLQQVVEVYINEDGTIDSEIGERVLYTRLPKGVTAASLANAIADSLCEQIPRLVADAGVDGQRYYCLLICYCNEDPVAGWPPFLLLGNEAMIDSNKFPRSERTYYLWAPDELRQLPGNVEIPFSDEALLENCRLHSQVISSIQPIKKVLKQVVEKMQDVSWADLISITDNFVISAVDNTSEIDQAVDIKKYAPVQFRSLRRLKLI